MVLLARLRRRRFCKNCGTVVVAESGDSCPECGRFALTANGEKWTRLRDRRKRGDGEAAR